MSQPITGLATKLSTHAADHASLAERQEEHEKTLLLIKTSKKTLDSLGLRSFKHHKPNVIKSFLPLLSKKEFYLKTSESTPSGNDSAGHRPPQNLIFLLSSQALLAELDRSTLRQLNVRILVDGMLGDEVITRRI